MSTSKQESAARGGGADMGQRLLGVLREAVDDLSKHVSSSIGQGASRGKLSVSGWANPAGIVSASLSFLPSGDPTSESLDAGLSISPAGKALRFRADIAWSDGRIVAEVANHDIAGPSDEEVLRKVTNAAQEATAQMAESLPSLIAGI